MRCRTGTGSNCGKLATHGLIYAGEEIVYGYMCEAHARAVINEYRTKLDDGPSWRMVPIDENGNTLNVGTPE